MLVEIILDENSGHAAYLAAETLHSDRLFNLWFAECVKGKGLLDESNLIQFVEEYDHITNQIMAATGSKGGVSIDLIKSLTEALVWYKVAPMSFLDS